MKDDAAEIKRRRENARKAREAADRFFPGEKWVKIEGGIYLSPQRAIGKNSNYSNELRDAQILRDWGSTIYLTPEARSDPDRKCDAIVDGMKMEFKNQRGASILTLKDHFLTSREQAPNVFINLEDSSLTRKRILRTLYRARNSDDYAKKSKDNKGGIIILKINGIDRLIYLDVDDLKEA
jgi:hypothetical protein